MAKAELEDYTDDDKISKSSRKKYIKKAGIYIILFLVLITFGTILLNKSLKFNPENLINYKETSNLDYKVYLLENDFYEQDYLGKDMLYVASLIDKIVVDFNYDYTSDSKRSIDFNYSIVAKLSITNQTETKAFFEKNYTLLDNKEINMETSDKQSISEEITIDYKYYNALANSFKNKYGVDSVSKLTVYMIVNKKNTKDSDFTLDNNSIMNIEIPLTEKAIDITLDYKEINEESNIIEKKKRTIKDFIPIAISIILIILSMVMMIKAIRRISLITGKKNAYDKTVAKILKQYDRLIAESSTLISFTDKEIVKINKFSELLDIHDNLQIPIMYYSVKEHESCYFYINHENIVYLLNISSNKLDKLK